MKDHGRNEPEMSHVRKTVHHHGNEGFSARKGIHEGAEEASNPPVHSTRHEQAVRRHSHPTDGGNHHNHPEGGGVVDVKTQHGERKHDSPVPAHAGMPHPEIVSKASEAASADASIGDRPHPSGVLGRG